MSSKMEISKNESLKRIKDLKAKLDNVFSKSVPYNKNICVYVCGSLGRLEMTDTTDLDLFFIIMRRSKVNDSSNLEKYSFFAELLKINNELGYNRPSKGGMYWDFIPKYNLLDIGSRKEDFNNSFTARMLLILESKPIFNKNAYGRLVSDTVKKYFADYSDYKNDFYPLYLINDIERYWRTLTLNYEHVRDVNDDINKRYWKRLKLKYARLITCYSMIACLFKENITPDYVTRCIKMTPFDRIHMLSDMFSDSESNLKSVVERIIKEYEWFLDLRKEDSNWWDSEQNKELALSHANYFHTIIIQEFMNKISLTNPSLKNKLEIY